MAHFSIYYEEPQFLFKSGKVTIESDVSTNGDNVTYSDTYIYVDDVTVFEYEEPYTVESHLLASAWTLIDGFF